MKERPILFNSHMVRAILDGRKTQTRRIANITGDRCKEGFITTLAGFVPRSIENHISYCPYGKPGDRLWVRETFCYHDDLSRYIYEADGVTGVKWKPSIHMPRCASRILLEVTNVRVERLQDISDDDVIAEGCIKFPFEDDYAYTFREDDKTGHATGTGAYRNLWESIYGQGSFDLNPFVWILEFNVTSQNERN